MTKKLLALLFAALMVITVLAGCQTTQVYYESEEGEADGDYEEDEVIFSEETDASGNKKTLIKTRSTRAAKTTKGKGDSGNNVVGGVATRPPKSKDKVMKFTPVADAGADYTVKGEVTIAVDQFRPTDYDAMFDVMEEMFPNIKIKYAMHQSKEGHDNDGSYLTDQMTTGTAPDIIWDDASNVLNYASKGWVYPLNDMIRNDPEAKYVPANLRSNYTYGGFLYALPHQAVFEVTVFNNNLLKQAGRSLPALSWDYASYEDYLNVGADLYGRKLAVAVSSIDHQVRRYSWYHALEKDPNGNYGARGYNLATNSFDFNTLKESAAKIREWRTKDGVDGWYMSQSKTGGQSHLQATLGVASSSGLFDIGKALMYDTDFTKVDRVGKNLWKFDYTMWPAPNKNGHMGVHVDHCVITTNCKKENLPAAWQLLRFMTYSSNGNLARLSMYKTENQKLYALNSHVLYPTTTNPEVMKAFNALPGVTDVDKYMLQNLSKSQRIDAYKLIPSFNEHWTTYCDGPFNTAINGKGDSDLSEAVPEINKVLKQGYDSAVAAAKSHGEKTGVKPN